MTPAPPPPRRARWRPWLKALRQGDRERVYELVTWVTILNFGIFTVVPLEAEPWALNASSLVLALLSYGLRKRGVLGHTAAVVTILGIAFANITYTVVVTNGMSSSVTAWYFVLPVPALMTLGTRALLPLIALTLVTVGGIATAEHAGWLPAYQPPDDEILWRYVSFTAMMLSVLALPLLYQDIQGALVQGLTKRNQELSEARDHLLQEQQQKDQFVASVSHELRTPMNAIIGFLQAIDRGPELAPKSAEMLSHMDHSAKHLLTLINDLLDFSQLQTGKLRLQPQAFSLPALVSALQHMFTPMLQDKGVAFAVQQADDLPTWVWGDPDRINQILINLLGNATKFTSAGQVQLAVHADGAHHLQFVVSDTGPGIAAHELPKVFDRFSNLTDRTRRTFGGTGLGLSISKQLAELQGGEITVQSRVGEGSVFSLRLPLKATEAPIEHGPTPNAPEVGHLSGRVLIVDDSPVNRIVARQLLLADLPKLHIDEAADGEEGLSMAERGDYAVVLMDVVMPKMDGIQATQAIRRSALSQQPMIIGLTANVTGETRGQALASGMDMVIGKPYSREQLVQSVARHLRAQPAKP